MSEKSKESSTEKEQEESVTVTVKIEDQSEEKSKDKSEDKSEDKFEIKLEDKSKDKLSNSEKSDEEVHFSSKYSIPKLNLKTIQTNSKTEKIGLYDSEGLELKKNIMSERNSLEKSEIKKINEAAISTDRGTTERDSVIKIRNNHSHGKRYSVFKLIEKDKRYKRDLNSVFLDQRRVNETNETSNKKERTDIYGNIINKQNKKKVKVSFIDNALNKPLAEVIEIQSYKNFNYIEGMPKEREVKKVDTLCVCCSVF